jgi:hypothetical protein
LLTLYHRRFGQQIELRAARRSLRAGIESRRWGNIGKAQTLC